MTCRTAIGSIVYSTEGKTLNTIPAMVDASRREPAQRSADGIEVTLYRDSILDAVSVEVRDAYAASSAPGFALFIPEAALR